MEKLSNERVRFLNRKFLGKKVSVTNSETRESFIGVAKFIGYNKMLPGWGFQVTVNRLPVQHVDPDSIKLYP